LLERVAALLMLVAPGTAQAQAASCSPPAQIPRPRLETASASEPRRFLPIGGYTLALSWSPQYCATARGADSAIQCGGRSGRFGFVLHGLWPEGEGSEWPQYCRPAKLLPRNLIRENLCTTPSVQLLQHEWAKHGSCMATRPELYFDLSRALYGSIRYPDMNALARRDTLTVADFVAAFVRVNSRLKPHMIRVQTARGNRLKEIWLCMDRAMEFARCPARQRGAPAASRLRIEPGPAMPRTKRAAPTPPRRPALILDLDPNARAPAN
jgi:ribonuclease T2